MIAVPVGGVDDEARGPDRVARGQGTEVNVEEGIRREGNDGGVDGDEDARNGNRTSVGETTASRESVASVKVRMMKRELQWMRSLRKEVNELQALKRRLESLRAARHPGRRVQIANQVPARVQRGQTRELRELLGKSRDLVPREIRRAKVRGTAASS